MPVFNPQLHGAQLLAALSKQDDLIVACYCAAWCDSCKKYQIDFNTLAERRPQNVFIWIDIEEHPELLGEDDVENFPTLLIQGSQGNVFFGPMAPQITHLERLLASLSRSSPVLDAGPPDLRSLLTPTA